MRVYLQNYGPHFSKKMYEFAVRQMRKSGSSEDGQIKPIAKDDFATFLEANGVSLKNDILYDGMYILAMCKADYAESSIEDDKHIALFVKDTIDDADAVDGQIFNRFYADCCLKGIPIDWEEML